MKIGDHPTLGWHGFTELSGELLYEILRFRQAIFVVEQRSPYPDLDGLDQEAQHLTLRTGGTLAGYLRVVLYSAEKRVTIGRVAIAPAARGQGLARCLMDEALARCRRDYKASAITLSAQAYLVPFYQSLGFRPTSLPYDDYGVPHVEMESST